MATFDFQKLLQDAKAGGAWPDGQYDMEIVQADATTANSGSAMVVAKLRCLTGPFANKHITNNFVLSVDNPIALNIFFKNMRAFGLDDNFFLQLGNGDHSAIANNLLGKRARVTLGHRPYQGVDQNKIDKIEPLSGAISTTSPTTVGMPQATEIPQAQSQVPPQQSQPVNPPQQTQTQLPAGQPQTLSAPMNNQVQGSIPPPPTAPYSQPEQQTQQQPVQAAAEYVATAPNQPAQINGAPTAAPATDQPPMGYPPEVWARMPDAAKEAILQSLQTNPI